MSHIVELYNLACRTSLELSKDKFESWETLYKSCMHCRQALTCCVCLKIVENPVGPELKTELPKCKHLICGSCKGGKMRLKPACGWCTDHQGFVGKPEIVCVADCFKRLCRYISPYILSTNNIHSSLTSQEKEHFRRIIEDGLRISNDYVMFISSLSPDEKFAKSNYKLTDQPKLRAAVRSSTKRAFQRKRQGTFQYHAQIKRNKSLHPRISSRKVVDMNHKRSPSNDSMNFCGKDQDSDITDSVQTEHGYNETVKLNGEARINIEAKQNLSACNENTRGTNVAVFKHSKSKRSKNRAEQFGCRCGLATQKPGNLTCCGQRCPCYSAFKGCESCKCRGCRNPRGDSLKSPMKTFRIQRLRITSIQSSPRIEPYGYTRVHVPDCSQSDIDLEIDS